MMSKELSINTIPDWLNEQLDVGRVMNPEEAYDFYSLLERSGKVKRSKDGTLVYLGVAQENQRKPVGIGGIVTPKTGMHGCVIFGSCTVPFDIIRPQHPYATKTSHALLDAVDKEFLLRYERKEEMRLEAPWHAALNSYAKHLDQLFNYGLLIAVHERRPGLDFGRVMTVEPANLFNQLWLDVQYIRFRIDQMNNRVSR